MDDDDHPALTVIVGALYVLVVGIQVYVVVDQLTGGRLTEEATMHWRRFRARWAERRRIDAQVAESLPWVHFAVHEALREGENGP